MKNKLNVWWKKTWATLVAEDLFTFIALPTIATFAFYFGFNPILQEMAFIFFGLALFWRDSIRHPLFWIGLQLLLSVDLYFSWINAANHTWVMWYWGIVMMIASLIRDVPLQRLIMTNNARWLLIVIMLVAVFWKVINPYYMDGSFFERNLVENPLMTTFTHAFGGLSWEAVEENNIRTLVSSTKDSLTYSYQSTPLVGMLAIFVTWWVLLIELVIGILLLFYKEKYDLVAHICHMVFIALAYFAVAIFGFAWILVVLGAATAGQTNAYLRPWYTLLFALLLCYALPWNLILFNVLGWFPLW